MEVSDAAGDTLIRDSALLNNWEHQTMTGKTFVGHSVTRLRILDTARSGLEWSIRVTRRYCLALLPLSRRSGFPTFMHG